MIEVRDSALAPKETWDRYGWIITRDHGVSGIVPSRVGINGPATVTEHMQQRLRSGEGATFRMYDGDGELIYTGRFIGDDASEDGFAPLDDFGHPDAGCTSIHYRMSNGVWREL